MKSITTLLVTIFLLITCITTSYSQKDPKKILVLSNDSLYIYDIGKNLKSIFTEEKGNVNDFSISPQKQYVAYTVFAKDSIVAIDSCKIKTPIEEEPEDGCEGGDLDVPISTIYVKDIKTRKIVKEIPPQDSFSYLYLLKWIDTQDFLVERGTAEESLILYKFRVYGRTDTISYYSKVPTLNIIDKDTFESYQPLEHLEYSDIFSKNCSVKFIKDSINQLHKFSNLTNKDLVIGKITDELLDAELSNNSKTAAWVERRGLNKTWNFYSYNVYSITFSEMKKIELFNATDSGSYAEKCLTFSPSDSIISIELDKKTTLINRFTNEKIRVLGQNVDWLDSNRFIFMDSENLIMYDIKQRKRTLLLRNVRKAKVL